MAQQALNVLQFCGHNLTDLYLYEEKQQVDAFLLARANNPDINPALGAELRTIYEQLQSLSLPNGPEYQNAHIVPNQHIYRTLNPRWRATNPINDGPKFHARHDYTHPLLGDDNRSPVRYWAPYDLLGLFLSKLGPVPCERNPSKSNFFLPLTAVYGRWCMLLGGNRDSHYQPAPGVGDPSYCYNCTWNPNTGEFFLGAVLAGYDLDNPRGPRGRLQNRVGDWEMALKWNRYSVLERFHNLRYHWHFDEGPMFDLRGPRLGKRFGNCAETYPFLHMLGEHRIPESRQQCHGLALFKEFALLGGEYNRNKERALRDRYLMWPCRNCQGLLHIAGGQTRHFGPMSDFN